MQRDSVKRKSAFPAYTGKATVSIFTVGRIRRAVIMIMKYPVKGLQL